MPTETNELGLKLYKRAEKLKSARQSIFDPAWQDLSQYFLPDLSDINTEKTEGTTNWFDDIYESSPIRAASTCSIGVRNWVTPSTDPWLGLAPPSNLPQVPNVGSGRMKRLNTAFAASMGDNGQDDATKCLSEYAEELTTDLSASNFYSVIQPFNKSACIFGTALLFCEEGKNELFRFEQFKVGTYCIAENDQKLVDTVFRWFKLTVRQAVQKFCEQSEDGKYDMSKLPKKMQEAYEKQKYDEAWDFIHCVYPNEDYKAGKIGKDGMAIASVYMTVKEKKVVKESGYEEMPYFCLRWSRWGTDDQPYGCSPAFETLPEARQINYVVQNWDALVELKAFPRILYPDNLDGNVQLAAGGVTVVGADDMAAGKIPKEWMTDGQEMSLEAIIARKEKAINDAFFVDIFKMFDQLDQVKGGDHTAFEIAQRLGEKLDKFTGTFDQYVTELINPLVRRLLGIAFRAGRLKQPPASLMIRPGNDPKAAPQLAVPKVVINSRVTLALKALRNTGTQNTLQTLMPLAETRPDILDNFNLDKISRRTGRNFGMAEDDFNPMEYVTQLRQQRAQQAQQERAMALAEQAASAAGKLGKAPRALQDAASEQLTGAAA